MKSRGSGGATNLTLVQVKKLKPKKFMGMMESTRNILTFVLVIALFSCNDTDKGVWIPKLNKRYMTPLNLEEDIPNLVFTDYLGFTISIDSLFLNQGIIEQDLNLGDIVTNKQINTFKKKKIQSIRFIGKGFSKKKFSKEYGVVLKEIFTEESQKYQVVNLNQKEVGEVIVSGKEKNYQLILLP